MLSNSSTSPTGSRNHLASFRFQNTFRLNVWNRDGDRWFSDPVGEVLNSFKWKHFVGEIILLNVRWYLKYPLSYRNLKEMMIERDIQVDHSTIMRWVHQYSPEIEEKIRRHLRPTNDSWRVDETYIKVKVRQEAVTGIANQSAPYPFRVSLL